MPEPRTARETDADPSPPAAGDPGVTVLDRRTRSATPFPARAGGVALGGVPCGRFSPGCVLRRGSDMKWTLY